MLAIGYTLTLKSDKNRLTTLFLSGVYTAMTQQTPDTPPGGDSQRREPDWLHEFEELANRELEHGSSCEQVHPIVLEWYEKLLDGDPPSLHDRDSVVQATACLTTEIINTIPDEMYDKLTTAFDEDEMAGWIEYVLMIGRAFERSLHDGELDDL